MRKTAALCLCFILLLSFVFPVFGETYELDPFTGQIVGAEDDGEFVPSQARVSSNCIYDKASGMFVFSTSIGSGTDVASSVFNGEITTDSVTLAIGDAAQVDVYLNGRLLDVQNSYTLTDPGFYTVRDRSTDREIISFAVIDRITGAVSSYSVPSIYFVSSATRNDEPLGESGMKNISLAEEGDYKIKYVCSSAGISKTLSFHVDHSAPVLDIQGIENGIAKGPVTIGELEPGSELVLIRDGERVAASSVLKTAGDYVATYTDEAGNSSTYAFTIRIFFDINAWLVVSAVAAIFILVIGFMIYSRKHMRTY